MKHLVIGMGEIGTSLMEVLKARYNVVGVDKDTEVRDHFDVIHICYPHQDWFVDSMLAYKQKYLKPGGLIIIHSTVPLGTTEQLDDCVHSPVRGVHPHLEEGIRTFVKYFGGKRAEEAAKIFNDLGIPVLATENPRNTEALKLWSTTQYGMMIALNKKIKEYCDLHELDFDIVYKDANETYNLGYTALDMPHVRRPVLKYMEGGIGGHCVLPNCELLGGDIAQFILDNYAV